MRRASTPASRCTSRPTPSAPRTARRPSRPTRSTGEAPPTEPAASRRTLGPMELETLGHASLLIRDDAGQPVLLTDPWLLGSCYWRSWWLQNYPAQSLLDEVNRVAYCFITHEHPDHFHTASIRTLDKRIQFLAPALPEEHIGAYLAERGHHADVVSP